MAIQSKAQLRLMKGISGGSIKPRGNLTVVVAAKFMSEYNGVGLPERVGKQSASERRKQRRSK